MLLYFHMLSPRHVDRSFLTLHSWVDTVQKLWGLQQCDHSRLKTGIGKSLGCTRTAKVARSVYGVHKVPLFLSFNTFYEFVHNVRAKREDNVPRVDGDGSENMLTSIRL